VPIPAPTATGAEDEGALKALSFSPGRSFFCAVF
jgi:hypothetical protein